MLKGTTSSGFKFEVSEDVLDNMELVDTLAEMQDDNPLEVSKVVRIVLGPKQRSALYEHLRTEDGRVPVIAVSEAIMDIFNAFGQKGKNS